MAPKPSSSIRAPWTRLAGIALVVAGAAYLCLPLQKKITLGLDLQGGTYMDLQVDLDEAVRSNGQRTLDGLRQELADKGVTVTSATQEKPGRLVLQGIQDKDKAEEVFDRQASAFDRSWTGDGVTLTLRGNAESDLRANAARQVKETIGRRINEFGVAEPLLQTQGTSGERIVLELPGLDDADRVKRIITTASVMEFRLGKGAGAATKEEVEKGYGGSVPGDIEVLQGSPGTSQAARWYSVQRSPIARGEDLIDARTTTDRFSHPAIAFSLNPDAGKHFGEITGKNIGQPLAIVIDNKVVQYATIQDQIFSNGQITGKYTVLQAQDAALTLRSGGLPAKVSILHEQTVGPSLGRDSIAAGMRATLYACIGILAFMLIWYKGAGINAIVALAMNILIVLGAMAMFGATLTLPGIAGLVLMIGMAVDANVLIFERIREELSLGKSPQAAVATGFSRVFWTIFDSHVTALISGFFLLNFGSGPIKGFAVTLMIGLVASMFTSVYVSHVLFDLVFYLRPGLKTLSIEWRRWRAPSLPFMRFRYLMVGVSWFLVAVSALLWATRGLEFGIDFVGGTQVVVKSGTGASAQDLRDRLAGTEFGNIVIQQFGAPEDHSFLLRVDDAEASVSTASVNAAGQPVADKESVAQRLVRVLGQGKDAADSRLDVNAVGTGTLADALQSQAGLTAEDATRSAEAIVKRRNDTGTLADLAGVGAIPGVAPGAAQWLQQNARSGQFAVISAESVGPAVGNELKGQAVKAVLFSMIGILAYIWFRFELRFAIGAIVATLHDVVITIGFLSLVREPVDISVIAALLTVVGFSLNDTVVVFDRIRETMRGAKGMSFKDVIDLSVNQTLSRTTLTSGLTLLSILSLYFFGGPVLHGFALAMTVGIIVGTYSSIFVASPIVLFMEKRLGSGGRRAAAAA